MRSEHFRAYAESKTRTNLYYMLFSALAGTALTTVLILLSPVIIKGWQPQPVYFVFYPIFAVFILFAACALGKKKISAAFVRSMCMLMCVLVLSGTIIISVFPQPDNPEIFFSLLIIMLPTVFVVRPVVMDIMTAVMSLLFVFLSYRFKPPVPASLDAVTTLASVLLSWLTSYFVYHMRMRDFAAQKELYELSSTDTLTSLLNKRSGEYNCLSYMRSAGAEEDYTAIMLDLDDFKAVNDVFGHMQGDKVLAAFGRELKRAFRSDDIVSRIGGDEFFVLLRNIGDEGVIRQKAENVLNICGVLNEAFGTRLGVSMGIVIVGRESVRPLYEQLYKAADTLLYKSKHSGKNTYVVSEYKDIAI